MFLSSIILKLKKSNYLFKFLITTTGIWTILFIVLSVSKFDGFYSGFRDLGIYDQALWNIINGNGLHSSLDFLKEANGNLLAQHGEIILFLLAPLYFIIPDPKILLILQVISVFSSSIPLYLIANKILSSSKIALCISLSFLLYAPLEWASLFEFNTNNLVIPIVLWGFLFLISGRKYLFYGSVLLALSIKEIIAVMFIFYGLILIIKTKYHSIGRNIIIISSIWAVFMMGIVIPSLNHGTGHPLLSYFSDTPITYQELFLKIFSLEGIKMIINPVNAKLLLQLFLPIGLLVFLNPLWVLPILPQLGLQLFALKPEMKLINFHYSSTVTAFLFIALVFSIQSIKNKSVKKISVIIMMVCSVITNFWFSPSIISKNFEKPPYLSSKTSTNINNILKTIPKNKTITTTQRLGSHLSQRKDIYIFPDGLETSEYIVLDTINFKQRPWLIAVYQENRSDVTIAINTLKKDTNYTQSYSDENLTIFIKK